MNRRTIVLIDEARCIGCARCLDACPADAIVGAQGLMHTVVEPWCIGCDLCIPACPVDCIAATAARAPWREGDRRAARGRVKRRLARLARMKIVPHSPEARKAILSAILERKRGG